IPGLLTEFVVLGLQAVDQGAQFSHFRAQVLHRGGQLGRNLGLLLGMVQKQVTAQGWLMSTPEGDAPDPTLTRWGSLAVASWTPSHPALVTHEDPRVEPCLIPCGPSWSLSRLPAGPVLRSPLLVRLEMASICMHDTPRNATFSETIARLPGGLSEQIAIKGRSSW